MALNTVAQYISRARALILDEAQPYRYPDTELVEALNMGLLEIRRLRPEILKANLGGEIPEFSAANTSAVVPVDPQYRPSLLYYICGQAHLRDDEISQEGRAASFLNKFVAQMLTIRS